jgi:hypothetical protein
MTAVVYRASAALVTVQRVIRIVTGKPCRQLLEPDAAAKIGLDDMIIAVRFDRTPSACMAELRRLAAEKGGHEEIAGSDPGPAARHGGGGRLG